MHEPLNKVLIGSGRLITTVNAGLSFMPMQLSLYHKSVAAVWSSTNGK